MTKAAYLLFVLTLVCNCKNKPKTAPAQTTNTTATTDQTIASTKTEKQLRHVYKAKDTIVIDAVANDSAWAKSTWYALDQVWLGDSLTKEDYSGRFKLSWTADALYVLAEIQDDTLIDTIKDPLERWWDDDCLEIFVDEDNSGGEHQYNHNAFAYHIALDGNVADMSTEKIGKLYNSHVESKNRTIGNTTIWEVKMALYDDSYNDKGTNTPVALSVDKKIGFAIAYCDNDKSLEREHFIGSIPVEGEDKNRGWIDANIFGTLLLKD
ncbi:sugar-binding protein [Winogradskyella arenosi]|uniref:Carbohydrate binding protein with CBM9 domain n=1 Tax=Winogradskyella arenosi TaxID=533325 RepID=A0A368ZDX6_9FLAO|nr:sugar-binding protein [Winogradskyella arenosi]RCW91449.1 carbohydrate binding protein with CBM9 domain [Winogradskyella arenosi]